MSVNSQINRITTHVSNQSILISELEDSLSGKVISSTYAPSSSSESQINSDSQLEQNTAQLENLLAGVQQMPDEEEICYGLINAQLAIIVGPLEI